MHASRIETAIEERTHRMIGVSRSDVWVNHWTFEGGGRYTTIRLRVPIGTVPTARMHEWIAYLDWVAPGHVSVRPMTRFAAIFVVGEDNSLNSD
jgi:hypothetical protein